jgi:RNA polymerase sigma factor (sigma-70 family)
MGFIIHWMGPDRRGDCDDVFQKTVIAIEENLETYTHRREGGFRSWCFKIAQNKCISEHRVKSGHPSPAELLSFEELQDIISVEMDDGGSVPRHPTAMSEQKTDIRAAFEQLNPVDQAVIHLHSVSPVSDAEIAQQINKPVDHIRKIRNKALKKLKKLYEDKARRKRS